MPVHILIGLNHYWDIVKHKVVKTEFGPRLLDTRVGWVLSGGASTPVVPQAHSLHKGAYLVSRRAPLEVESGESLEDILHKLKRRRCRLSLLILRIQ